MCGVYVYYVSESKRNRELQHFFAGCAVEGLPALCDGMLIAFPGAQHNGHGRCTHLLGALIDKPAQHGCRCRPRSSRGAGIGGVAPPLARTKVGPGAYCQGQSMAVLLGVETAPARTSPYRSTGRSHRKRSSLPRCPPDPSSRRPVLRGSRVPFHRCPGPSARADRPRRLSLCHRP